jgi:Uma2 family endonuclease
VRNRDLAPLQGLWSKEQYLKLTNQTNRLIEFTDGVIEMLPIPTREHQKILAYLYRNLFVFIQSIGGLVLFAPLRVQVRPGKFREPDLLVLLDEHDPRNQDEFWLGADLVVEIVSPDKPERDTQQKPRDYAEAGIAEYWIVNPLDQMITVLTLQGDVYHTYAICHRGESVTSPLLGGFDLGVDAILNAT